MKIFEAVTKIKGKTKYGYSYESALFALTKLVNDNVNILSANNEIVVRECDECETTGMLFHSVTMFTKRGTYKDLQKELEA